MWYAIVERTTGRLVSTGSALVDATEDRSHADALKDLGDRGLDVVELGDDFSQESSAWDEGLRQFVPVLPVVKQPHDAALDDALAALDDLKRKLMQAKGS